VAQNFLPCDRDQELLLPPSLREWLPADHLAWFVLEAVDEIDLSDFYGDYRDDGWGRAAFDPRMMVALLLYAYAIGERSSRAIERRCREDVAFRVICANSIPDHATIARFRARHEAALAAVFTEVLRLCAEAGLVSVGLLALDGTKLRANASQRANRSYAEISAEVERMLREAAEVDAAEDERLGEARGDELPEGLRCASERRQRLRAAKRRLEAEVESERAAHEDHLARRAQIEAERGRPLRGRKPKPPPARVEPTARANTTDPDSRPMRSHDGYLQGYNAQAVTTEGQLIVAAEVSTDSPDGRLLEPMADAASRELDTAGIGERPGTLVADAGYWNVPQIERVRSGGTEVLVATESGRRGGAPKPPAKRAKRMEGAYREMHEALRTPRGRELYRRRQPMIEPVFAQTKITRRADRFLRRGLSACRSEWRLIAATHNLLKLWRHGLPIAQPAG
jgi:transposase